MKFHISQQPFSIIYSALFNHIMTLNGDAAPNDLRLNLDIQLIPGDSWFRILMVKPGKPWLYYANISLEGEMACLYSPRNLSDDPF